MSICSIRIWSNYFDIMNFLSRSKITSISSLKCLAQDQEVSVRQPSSVLLKNWIEQLWSASSEKFKDPTASNETKLYLRQNLPQGLAVPQRPIRSVLSAALANIAGWDWPETWPELVPSLLQALDQSDSNMVDGALRTLR